MKIEVWTEPRPDGGIRVWSNDLPGLILSGPDRVKVLSDIEPAARLLLHHRGIDASSLEIVVKDRARASIGNWGSY